MARTLLYMATTSDVSRGIAAEVRTRLEQAGFTPRAVEGETGIPATTLRRRLTGDSPFVVTELEQISRLLGVNITDITSAAEAAA